ncbi:MAG: NfeD family protein [Bacteroidaceae bacterium]|nr:NfeD family protein [Bacteroidaceae bacterium]
MTAFYVWLGIAFLLFILEILITSTFALLCFAVGSIVAAVAGLVDLNVVWQLIVFAIISLMAFLFIRPGLLKHLNARSATRPKTNVDALIDRKAKVVERIAGSHQLGRVAIDGDNWQALSADEAPIEVGEQVIVESIDSIILTVRRANLQS